MTEDDDATDVRLRDRAELWRRDAPPIPDVDDALRRARSRTRRPRVLLQVAAVAVLVLVISVGAVVLARHASNSRHDPSQSKVPAATIAELTRVATVGARRNGDPSASAQAVETTLGRAQPVLGFSGGNGGRTDARVWLIQLRGDFECDECSRPLSGPVARRKVLTEILLEPSLGMTAFGLSDTATDLSRFGRVIDLPLRRTSVPAPTPPTETPKATPTVNFSGTAGPNQFVFTVGTGPDGAAGSHLVVTDTSGRHARNIGPKAPANYEPDSVFFLDARHGWFLVANGGDLTERLYRTSDGGKTWQSFVAPGHNGPGSSTVQFTSSEDGWLTDTEPTGSNEGLYRTRDGGATWQLVAALGRHTEPAATLPRLGLVNFTPDGSRGWLGGLQFGDWPLDYTTDQGRHWHDVRALQVGQDHFVGSPSIFGATLVVPVAGTTNSGDSTKLSTYVSHDGGNSWSRNGSVRIASGAVLMSAVFPTVTSGWAVTTGGPTNRLIIRRTTDQGRTWKSIAPPNVTRASSPTVTALDGDHAVIVVTTFNSSSTRAFATSNGGHTWHRIDQDLTHT